MRPPAHPQQPVGEADDDPFMSEEENREEEQHYYEWSNREVKWYVTENRLLFVAENAHELQRWLTVLQWLVGCESS